MVFCGRAVDLLAGRLTTACSCRDPAGIVLRNGDVGATLGAGRLRAPGPAGLRHGGGASQLTLSSLARPKSVRRPDGGHPRLDIGCERREHRGSEATMGKHGSILTSSLGHAPRNRASV